MPKVSQLQVNVAAEACYSRLISSLGLQAAKKCNLIVGRLLRAEKKRRDLLDAESETKRKKKKRKSNKSKRRYGNKESADELPQLTSSDAHSSGNDR